MFPKTSSNLYTDILNMQNNSFKYLSVIAKYVNETSCIKIQLCVSFDLYMCVE